MALKFKLTKAAYDKLEDEAVKELYVEKDGGYVLDVSGIDDPAELRRARDREKAKADEMRDELEELRAARDDADRDKTKKSGDIDKLEASWQKKFDEATEALQAKLDGANDFIKRTLVNTTAATIATEISTVPKIMAKAIAERISVDFADGEDPKIRVLDAEGKPSAATIEDLQQEFVANKEFSSIIVGSKAKGSGTASVDPAGGAGVEQPKTTDLSKLGSKDLASHLKAVEAAGANT